MQRDPTTGSQRPNGVFNFARPVAALLVCSFLIAISTGCHRGYYRRQADSDARSLIREKLNDPRWNQIEPSIDINPESRMFDPFSADHPPMPPDDPASNKLMHCVDDKQGYPLWNANGNTGYVSNPQWRSYLPVNEQGVLELNVDRAVQLSLLNSTLWQREKEDLFLSALNVSLARFGFDTQASWGWQSFFRTRGELSGGFSSIELDRPTPVGSTQISRLGATGTELLVGIANSIIWRFGGGVDSQTGTTLINASIIQPLLRGAGRDVILESLTQVERTLLADIRGVERFRRGFYLFIVTGRRAGDGALANLLNEPDFAILTADGYLGLLLTQQSIRIAEFNVQSLQNVLNQFREFFTEERIDLLQVVQAENSLYDAQGNLLEAKVDYQNALDSYKRDLGLPPDVPIIVEDPFLSRFELIDDQLLARQLQITALRDEIGEQLEQINPFSMDDDQLEIPAVEWSDELQQNLESLGPFLDLMEPLFQAMQDSDVTLIRKDFDRMRKARPDRLRKLAALREFIETSDIEFDIEPAILREDEVESADRLENELQELLTNKFNKTRDSLITLRSNVARLIMDGPGLSAEQLRVRLENDVLFEAPEILTQVANIAIELNLLQARARVDSITLPDVDISAEDAFAIALQFRRDLMNARAALVDAWRQIEFVADDLESTLDVVFEGNVGTIGNSNNPFGVNFKTNTFGVGLRFDAPITRLSERNAYRQALIEYQRTRRLYYNFEDSINQNLRQTIRELEQSRVLFQLTRRSIRTAIQQVELSQYRLIEPQRPGEGGGIGGSTLGPTAANDLTRALDALQRTQTDFVRIWVNYEVLRRGLDYDLGTMQLTPDGFWLDPGIISVNSAWRAAEAMGISPEDICLPVQTVVLDGVDVYGADSKMAPAMAPEPPVEIEPGSPQNDAVPPGQDPPAPPSDPNAPELGPRLGYVPQWLREVQSSREASKTGNTVR